MSELVAEMAWLLLEAGSGRYDAPLWVWAAVAGSTAVLSLAGLVIGRWFHRRRG